MNVTIVGAGYVGIVTGAACAYFGHRVTFLDTDERKLALLRQRQSPIHEPGLTELLSLAGDRIEATSSYPEAIPAADIVFITVGTPVGEDGHPDLTYIEAAAHSIGLHLGPGPTLVVNKSTVPVGSGNWVESVIREALLSPGAGGGYGGGAGDAREFFVASNPEFLREGSALLDTFYADRIVIGSRDAKAIALLSELYLPIRNQDFTPPAFLPRPEGFGAVPLVTTDLASAELIKYAANAFLTVKISFINEMATLANRVGADVVQLSRGIGLDARIGPRFLQAGIGWGGSCFAKDTSALIAMSRDYGEPLHIVEAARQVNCRQRERVIESLLDELKILKGRTIGILGVAFKPHTDDLRDAPALNIARRLTARGVKVLAHDPVALPRARAEACFPGIAYKDEPRDVFTAADAVVVATEWPEYQQLDWPALSALMSNPFLLDGRNCLDRDRMAAAGFRYQGVGR